LTSRWRLVLPLRALLLDAAAEGRAIGAILEEC
jgi:hypothetical protein